MTKKPTKGHDDQDLSVNVEIASDGTYLIRLLMHQTNSSTTIKKTDVIKIAPKTKQTEPQRSQLPRFRRRENLKLLSINSNNSSKSKREQTASTASHQKIIKLPPKLIKFCGLDDDDGQATDKHNKQTNSTKILDLFAIEPNQLNNRTIVENSSDLNTG